MNDASAVPALPSPLPTAAPDGFHVMAKPTGAICNLDCTYCFFLSKELLYPGDRFRMAEELLDTYVRQTLESQRGPQVVLAFQGGEPTLMGVGFYERTVELVRKYARPGQQVQLTLQTNGVLIDDRWAEFLAANDVLVGLSIDGPEEMHDLHRVDKAGRGTFDRVIAALELLRAHDVDVNVMCTVNAANADHPLEVYRFFRDELHMDFMQFIPVVERTNEQTLSIANAGWGESNRDRPLYVNSGSLVTDRSVGPEQWGSFLSEIFDEWVRNDVGDVFVGHFDAALAAWVGVEPGMCVLRETCGTAVALEHNGDLYSCDHFVEPDYLVGNIAQTHMVELMASPQQVAFGNAKRDTLPRYCLDCEVRFACNGECPRNRFSTTPDGEAGLNYLCAGYKHFFGHIRDDMSTMADLLRNGGAAPDIMKHKADEEAALYAGVGRNDPCPCGSGNKFKRCHGA
ncbi:MAG: anaerobic sulfatase maturase [Actinomycetia bacterium]|nr:anaerobic sulfatase maturase [Actinomycetes bacterium]